MDIQLESVFSMFYAQGESIRNFSYINHELIYFISGSGSVKINKTPYSYQENSVLLTKNTDVKDYFAETRTDYICIRFKSKKDIDSFISGIYPMHGHGVHQLFISVHQEYTDKKLRFYELCNMKTAEILIELSRKLPIDTKDTAIYRLINEIDSTMAFQKNISEIAKELNYNHDYLRQKFKKVAGISIKRYIIQQRIRNACSLLETGSYSCTEIAQICGFSSSSQFSRIFKEEMGYSPRFYQKE